MFHHMLVPVDFSDRNAGAIALAREFAQGSDGRVTLLHVIETLDLPFEEEQDFYRQLEEAARERLAALAAPLREAGVPVDQLVHYGKRVAEICRCADEGGADLIVIGSHRIDPEHPGRSWLTISHQVAILARQPVLVVK